MDTRPWETGVPWLKPAIATIAGRSTECFRMAAQVSGSGFQVWAAACRAVSAGGSLVAEKQRGSVSPMRSRSPGDLV